MWHEARRQEKATLRIMREHKKRAERRRNENRIDPESLLQVQGLKASLSFDPNIQKQADRALVPWQGDETVLIDRFDIRTSLGSIPDDDTTVTSRNITNRSNDTQSSSDEDRALNKLLSYERFRLLIYGDIKRIPEQTRIRLLRDLEIQETQLKKLDTASESLTSHHIDRHRFKRDNDVQKKRGDNPIKQYNTIPIPSSNDAELEDSCIDNAALKIPDLDQLVQDDLDDIPISDIEGSKRVSDIAKKYGLTGEDFLLLLMKEKDMSYNTESLILDLRRRMRSAQFKEKKEETEQVYGPPLPPQPSVSRIETKTQNSESPTSESTRLSNTEQASVFNNNLDHQECSNNDVPDSNSTELVSEIEPAPESTTLDNLSRELINQRGSNSKRRASTPLAYKRNRRSSRSLSRERHRDRRRARRNRSRCSDSHSCSSSCDSRSRSRSCSSSYSSSLSSSSTSSSPTTSSSSSSSCSSTSESSDCSRNKRRSYRRKSYRNSIYHKKQSRWRSKQPARAYKRR